MRSDWFSGCSLESTTLIERFGEDRDELLLELHLRYPELKPLAPSAKVEAVLTDICGFHVVDEPLPSEQFALCDLSNRIVVVNSDLKGQIHRKADVVLFRQATLAHELGHIRLHADEMLEGFTLHYLEDTRGFRDPRAYQREREADLYAALFLVSLDDLLEQPSIQGLLKCRAEREPMRNNVLWSLIYREARRARVSPTLLKRCLLDLGWIEMTRSSRAEGGVLQIRF